MSAEGIAAIVVAHDSEETLDACLSRLRAAEGVVEVRVVDNDSRDASMEVAQRHALADPRLRFIANPDNPGFAVACNQGVAASAAPWLAFVNPDCFVEVDTLARLRAHALGATDCAAAGPLGIDAASSVAMRVRGGDLVLGADLVDEDGVRDAAARRRDADFASMLRDRSRASLGVAVDAACALQPVDAVSGALMLVPRGLFERIGGFDEGYRLHAEDMDLCRRARAAGAIVACANDVRVVHVRGVSSRTRPLFVEWHKHRGFWRYFSKFEAARRGPLVRLAVFAMIWARFPLALARATGRALRG
ncbi:MAG TPA: glycosyltransferase family 2 protein [Thermomonas sp.]|nr:glycosyltransferase family 2 protein [Thermomonas sp.]